ncbi:MAG: preprotein translocase subunit SecE [Bdellovibrionales bacterium]|nr:preprotein translocase subunit SecE [Bdellovibrionales bacterium]
MDDNNKKIRAVAFIIAGALVAVVIDVLFESLAVTFGKVARLRNDDTFRHGLPIAVGVITFLVLQFNSKVSLWADEVISEVRKVVWPSKQEVTAMTMVVCVLVTVFGIGLGLFDFAAGHAVTTFVQTNFLSLLN